MQTKSRREKLFEEYKKLSEEMIQDYHEIEKFTEVANHPDVESSFMHEKLLDMITRSHEKAAKIRKISEQLYPEFYRNVNMKTEDFS